MDPTSIFSEARRSAVVAAAAGAAAALLLVTTGLAGWLGPPAGPVHEGGWTSRSRAWLTYRGIYDTQFTDGAAGPYNWTSPSLRIQIANIDRSRPYLLVLQIDGTRPPGQPRPVITWTIDGSTTSTHAMTADTERLTMALPVRDSTRAVVTAQITPAVQAGPDDPRALGVIVRQIGLEAAAGAIRPTWSVAARLAAAVGLAVLGVLLCGVPRVAAGAAALVIAGSWTWLLALDGAFLGTLVDTFLGLGTASALIGAIVSAVRVWRPAAATPGWSVALGFVLAVSIVKLAVFSHPLVTIGDGVFQVHRAALVQQGTYLFTSITPRPFFEFPYAVGLFVAAKPFWSWLQTDVDHVWLLRTLTIAADALVGVAFYLVAMRVWRQRTTALAIAGLWPFARAPLEALCNSNLPNVFGQGLFGVAVAGLIYAVGTTRRSWAVLIAASVVLAAAFLSHFSTVSIGLAIVVAMAAASVAAGGADGRRRAGWLLLAGCLAFAASYAIYYRHFGAVYRDTYQRIVAHEVVDEPGSAIAATPAVKLRRWWSGTSDDYGLPGLPLSVAAVVGAAALIRERRRDALTLALAGWLLTWMAFTALGILTAIQMRSNLATAPVFVCLGAYGLSALSRRGMSGAALAVVIGLAVVIDGAQLWLMCLGR